MARLAGLSLRRLSSRHSIPVAGAQALGVPEPLVAFPLTGLGARVSARLQMRPTQRLTAVVSKLSTVRMIDKLSLQLSVFGPLQGASGTKAAGWTHSTSPPS